MQLLGIVLLSLLVGSIPAQGQEWAFGGQGGQSWEEWAQLKVLADDARVPGALQPRELRPDVNILPSIFTQFPFERWRDPPNPLWVNGMPRLWRGLGNLGHPGVMMPFLRYVDGDINTFQWVTNFGPGGNKTSNEFYTIDPGAPLPLERFVLRLPPSEATDLFGEPWENYVPRQGELSATLLGEQIPTEDKGQFTYNTRYVPLDKVLGRIEGNLVAPIEITFPLQYFRYVRWRSFPDNGQGPFFDQAEGVLTIAKLAYAEFELYGRGFAAESRYESKVVDLGQPAILGQVSMAVSKWRRQEGQWGANQRWQEGALVAAPDADAEVRVRIKTGSTDDPRLFFTYNDQGELDEVDFATWRTLKKRQGPYDPVFVGWQGPLAEDRERWTPWSSPVRAPGAPLSLDHGRYFQVLVEMTSRRPTDVARLDSLRLELLPLLVPDLVGEVGVVDDSLAASLTEVLIGAPVDLTYAIRAEFGDRSGAGFDAVRVQTPSQPEFLGLAIGSPPETIALERDAVVVDETGLTLHLLQPIAADAELHIGLRTALYTISAQLQGAVFNRAASHARQFVKAGNATDRIHTDQLQIVATSDIAQSIGDLHIQPRILTPNGDGNNDRLHIRYALFGVLNAEVEVAFYTLAGAPVRRLLATDQKAGTNPPIEWDVRDEGGRLLAPGLYLCQVAIDSGRGRFATTVPIAVAY